MVDGSIANRFFIEKPIILNIKEIILYKHEQYR